MCLHDTRVALTHISVIPSDLQKILSHLDACCHSLGFTIRPVKCFFFFWFLMVGRLLKRLSLLLVVVVHPAYTWASYSFSRIYNWSPLTTPVNSLVRAFWSSLPLSSGLIKLRFVVNTRYGFIIIPSLHFKLAVNPIFFFYHQEGQFFSNKVYKSLARPLALTTVAVLHYPAVLNIPFLESFTLLQPNYLTCLR